jgi:two-component system, NtrC family, response regulator HydG
LEHLPRPPASVSPGPTSAQSPDSAGPAGTPAALGRFAEEIRRVAASDVTLLIEGESGSGKNLAARAAHAWSSRSAGAYHEVQLTALTPSLLEAELFGHEAGAFTGAERARVGRFLRAQEGTLVLDGIECVPPELQVKLLRVLQERAVEPLGSERSIPLDVRVIVLSNRDLQGEVRAGRFRDDLYYRLAVVKLRVPPLRARLEDLPALADELLARAAERSGVERRSLSDGALDRLRAHSWPGNLRELENALERASILAPRPDPSAAGDLPSAQRRRGPPPIEAAELEFLSEASAGVADDLARQALAHGIGLEALERAILTEALSEQRGNMSAAARRLGLSRRSFEHRYERSSDAARSPEDGGRDA